MRIRLTTAALITICALVARATGAGDEAPTIPELPADDWLAHFKEAEEAATSLRGTATMKAYGATEGTFNAAFAYAPPERARLEISTPLTGTLLILTARGADVLLYYPADNVAVVGADADAVFGGTLGGGNLFQLVDWLAGRPPRYQAELEAGEMTIAAEPLGDGRVTFTWRWASDGARLQQITVEAETYRLLGARLYEGEEAVFDATYEDWRAVGEATMPYAVTFKAEDSVVEIAANKLEVNVPIDDAAFSTEPPAGAVIRDTWPPEAEYYDE